MSRERLELVRLLTTGDSLLDVLGVWTEWRNISNGVVKDKGGDVPRLGQLILQTHIVTNTVAENRLDIKLPIGQNIATVIVRTVTFLSEYARFRSEKIYERHLP
jgi:hypothetical protein